MRKLVLDWFRNKNGDNGVLSRNAGWVHNYFSASGLIQGSLEDTKECIRRTESIYRASGMAVNEFSWAYLYDHLEKFPLAHNFFLDSCGDDIVIGYELSRAQLRAINDAGKTYINLCTHPFRFAPDYFLAASTNDPEINKRLNSIGPTRRYVDTNVGLVKARAARRYQRRMNPEFGLVFFAQIAVDSSRIKNGEIVDDHFIVNSLQKFVDELKPKNLYFKDHPHEKMSPTLRGALQKMKGKDITTPTYDLLSVEGLKLCALSSGVCHEAVYFGCDPTKFLEVEDNFPIIGTEAKMGQFVVLPTNILDEGFWNYILEGAEKPESIFPLPTTPYRTASGLAWG